MDMTDPQFFWLPKAGHSEVEYEDAFAAERAGGDLRVAVADGATEAAFAGDWARTLVRGYVDAAPADAEALAAALVSWREAWRGEVDGRTAGLPWYAEAKAAEGAYATLLGLTLSDDGRWRALSVGDCCLFHLRPEAPPVSWPVDDPEAFGHRPALLATRADAPSAEVLVRRGTWAPGDAFLLATDALAAWMLRAGVFSFTQARFPRVVEEARTAGILRNDDVTLAVVPTLS